MFTGLVEKMASIVAIENSNHGMDLILDLETFASDAELGDSIAIAGCCLTVVRIDGSCCMFQLGSETLSKTTFSRVQVGDLLNIERSLKVGERMGGHFVTGHVDGLGTLVSRSEEGEWSHFEFSASRAILKQMVTKGSITIDGVSLTVVEANEETFRIALIPHTLQVTTLGTLREGASVHLETDILAKYVQRAVSP